MILFLISACYRILSHLITVVSLSVPSLLGLHSILPQLVNLRCKNGLRCCSRVHAVGLDRNPQWPLQKNELSHELYGSYTYESYGESEEASYKVMAKTSKETGGLHCWSEEYLAERLRYTPVLVC